MSDRTKISVVSSALNTNPREAAKRAQSLGFAGLLFDAVSPAIDLTSLSNTGRREFSHVMRSSEQAIAAIRADIGTKGLGPGADVDRAIAALDKAANVARDLRAGCVAVDLLSISSDSNAALIALGAIADRYQISFAFSNSLGTLKALEDALAVVRCPWFGVDLDAVAATQDPWPPINVIHVRARDAIVGEGNRTKPVEIGKGSVNWLELFATLDAAGYHGFFTIDPVDLLDRTGAAQRGLAYLRSLTGT